MILVGWLLSGVVGAFLSYRLVNRLPYIHPRYKPFCQDPMRVTLIYIMLTLLGPISLASGALTELNFIFTFKRDIDKEWQSIAMQYPELTTYTPPEKPESIVSSTHTVANYLIVRLANYINKTRDMSFLL